MTFFDILKDIIKDKTGKLSDEPEFKKVFSKFMLVRYFSMDKRYESIAEKLNYQHIQQNMSDEDFYMWLIAIVPQSNNAFIKYIKKPPKSKDTVTKSST